MKTAEITTRLVADDSEQRSAGAGNDATSGSQSGQTTILAGGTSPNISANLTAASKIFLSLAAINGSTALGVPQAINVTPGQPGTFQVRSNTPGAPGTPLATDLSTYNYLILSP